LENAKKIFHTFKTSVGGALNVDLEMKESVSDNS